MKLVNKLDLDNPTLVSEHGSWKHAKNVQISEKGDYTENEDKLVTSSNFSDNAEYLGKIVIPDDIVLFHYYQSDEVNKLDYLEITREQSTKVARIRILDKRYKGQNVHGTYSYNHKGELIITFGCRSINNNTPELLIINYNELLGKTISLNSNLYNSILLNPNYFSKIPTIDLNGVFSGGNLLTGSYFIAMCYEDKDSNRSDFTSLSNPIVIADLTPNAGYAGEVTVGSKVKKSGQPTNKYISLTVNNLNLDFNNIRLAVLYYNDNTLQSISLTDKINITSESQSVIIDNISNLQNTALEQIIINNTKYVRAKTLTSNSNKLLLYNLKTDSNKFEDFQNIANNIVISYHTDKTFKNQQLSTFGDDDVLTYASPKNIYYNKPFKSGEVGAFYIGFKYIKGGFISVNTIPGYANEQSNLSNKLESYLNNAHNYPIDFPTYGGQPIKYHKFPEFNDVQGNNLVGNRGFKLLGINVQNIIIPDELKSICSGWEIFYAERTTNNITRLGQAVRLQRPNAMYSFDLQYNNIPLSLIKSLKQVQSYNLDLENNMFSDLNILDAIDFPNSNSDILTQYIRDFKYISGIDNDEEDRINVDGLVGDIENFKAGIYELITSNTNLYSNPFYQTLVSTGIVGQVNETSTGNKYGGDIVISRMSTRVTDFETIDSKLFMYCIESIYNLELRHEGTEEWEKIYPQSPMNVINNMPKDKGSYIKDDLSNSYDLTYSKINNIENPLINNEELDNEFKNRIAISDVNQSESTRLGWRIFRPNNYYDVAFNRGEGFKLISADKQLYIQNTYGLFLAQIKDVLQLADGSQAWLGTGDLFDRPPTEIMYKDSGGIGCKDYDSAIHTEFGYIVCDRDHNAIYIVNDSLQDITNANFKLWFSENNNSNKNDLINIGFDRDRKRLLINNKNIYVVSYSILSQGLTSFHDYDYIDIASTRKGTFLIHNTSVDKFTKQPTNLPSYIDVNIIVEPSVQKIFQAIIWETQYNLDKRILWDKTIDKIMVYNDTQCTGLLDVNSNDMWYNTQTGVYKADQWIFNKLFDAVINDKEPFLQDFMPNDNVASNKKNWYDMSQFICKFVTVRLHSNNDNNQRIKFLNLYVEISKDSR